LFFVSVEPSVVSHGVDINFYDVTEQKILVDYSSVEDFVDSFFKVISMVNPDVKLLSWQRDPPQGERCIYAINRNQSIYTCYL